MSLGQIGLARIGAFCFAPAGEAGGGTGVPTDGDESACVPVAVDESADPSEPGIAIDDIELGEVPLSPSLMHNLDQPVGVFGWWNASPRSTQPQASRMSSSSSPRTAALAAVVERASPIRGAVTDEEEGDWIRDDGDSGDGLP